jgi:hypothetical protein
MKSFAIRALALAVATLFTTPAQAVTTFTGQPLGLLFYGPYAGLEFGDRTSFALRGRLENLGVLAQDNYDNYEDETLLLGIGINAGIRHYFTGGQRGALIGYGAEVATSLWSGPSYESSETWGDQKTYFDATFLTYVEGGYRWIFGSGLVLTAAMATAIALPVVVSEYSSDEVLVKFMPIGEVGFVF